MQKQTWWYAGCLALLLAVAVYSLRQPQERGMQRLRFAPVARKAIDVIELSGATEAVLHKEGGQWRLSNGRAADQGAVERFLSALDDTEMTDFVTSDGDDFAEHGVVGPKATFVKLEGSGRERLAFSFLSEQTPEMMTAVLYRGEVFRGNAPFAMQATRKEADWLDRHLFDIDDAEVDRMDVKLSGEPAYALTRGQEPERQWQLADGGSNGARGKHFRFDAQAADSLLNTLRSTQLTEFVSPTPTLQDSGLGAAEADSWCLRHGPQADADSAQEPNAHVECLRVGKMKGEEGYYAKLDHKPDVFLLPASQVDGMRRRPNDLRALNTMAAVDFDEVTSGGIERPQAKPMLFAKTADGWQLTSKKPTPSFVLDKVKVNAVLRKMTFARAIGIAGPNEGAMTPSMGQLWVKTKDGKRHALRFGAPSGEKNAIRSYFAKGTIDDNIYRISKPLYDDLMVDAKTLAAPVHSAKAAPSSPLPGAGGSGLDSLPPDVRANIERQLAQQKERG